MTEALEAPFAWARLRAGGWTPVTDVTAPEDEDAWLVFAQEDALAAAGLQRLLRAWVEARPDASVLYGDDEALGGGERLRLKPAFNLPLLAAQDYVGAPVAIRAAAFRRLGGLDPLRGDAALYDLVLRAQAAGLVIERIPETLLTYPGERPAPPSLNLRRAALQAWVGSRPLEVRDGLAPGTLQLARRSDAYPEATLVVPTRQSGPEGAPYVVALLDSLAATDWPHDRLKVLIGDDSDRVESFPAGRWPFAVERLATPRAPGEPFNYAAKMNRLWRAAGTEHLVLMNDDVTVRSPGWLKALMTFAVDTDVGGVGARLLFPDGRLQHAGIVGGLFGGVVHAWFGQDAGQPTYQDWARVHRDWSMVTGAVFATRRSALESVNGFDERFTVEFNDVDLCLRMKLLGLRIVYTPFAELTHREKASRGDAPAAAEEVAAFLNRWRDLLADDPAYHPGLSRDRFAVAPMDLA